MSITNITKRIGAFYDDKGEYIGKKGFSKTDKSFDFAQGSFNVVPEKVTYTEVKRWYWDVHIYHYNINNPNPFNFSKKVEPIMDAELYNIMLKTKIARDLNDLAKGNRWDWLNFKTIAIAAVIIGILYALFQGKLHLGGG